MAGNIYVIAVGRFFWGVCAGSFTVVCPRFLNESVPIELKGPYGAINQLMATVGIMIPSLMSLAIPAEPREHKNDWYVTDYWRIIWLAAAFLALVQVVLLLTVFNYETPATLK